MAYAPRPWLAGLAAVVTAICAAPAQAAGADDHPLPSASWHGRPIQRPQDDAGLAVRLAGERPRAHGTLRLGAGFGRPGGSPQVREVQRLLRRIGYRPGPVDGLLGPRTRASVQWFQIKHGLPPTGAVDAATRALLDLRASGERPLAVTPVRTAAPLHGLHRLLPPGPSPTGAVHGPPVALAALAVACAAVVLALAGLAVRRRREQAKPATTRRPQPEQTRSAGVVVVGYAAGRDRRELRTSARAIERVCSERGWVLARLVREGASPAGDGRGRPGLTAALEALAGGDGTRLVVARLSDVGRSRRQLSALLGWCVRSGVRLVALDVGLDTGTPAGLQAARCLVAIGERERRPARAAPAARRAKARPPTVPTKPAAAAET